MSTEPKVSIIIPSYNRRELLFRAINSVLNQDYQNIEIIVVDDGSTDGTKELFKKDVDSKISYFYKNNEGLPSLSRNFGAQYATGMYLAFLDSDDYWESGKLSCQVKALESDIRNEFCYTQGKSTDLKNNTKISGYFVKKSGKVFFPLLFRNFVITSSVVMRTASFREIGGFSTNKELIIAEDLRLWLQLSKRGNGIFIEEPLVRYELGLSGVSSDLTKRFLCLREVLLEALVNANSNFLVKYLVLNFFWLRWFMKVRNDSTLKEEANSHLSNLEAGFLVRQLFSIRKKEKL